MIRVVIGESDLHVLKYLCCLLSHEEDMLIVGSAVNGNDALSLIERLHPDIVLMDVNLPGRDGIQVARDLGVDSAGVVLLSAMDSDDVVFEAMAAGARAFLAKTSPPGGIVRAIREVAAGGMFLESDPLCRLLGEFRRRHGMRVAPPRPSDEVLSPREVTVLGWMVQGYTRDRIAREMRLDHDTVTGHLSAACRKLGVRNSVHAAVLAVGRGWVVPTGACYHARSLN